MISTQTTILFIAVERDPFQGLMSKRSVFGYERSKNRSFPSLLSANLLSIVISMWDRFFMKQIDIEVEIDPSLKESEVIILSPNLIGQHVQMFIKKPPHHEFSTAERLSITAFNGLKSISF